MIRIVQMTAAATSRLILKHDPFREQGFRALMISQYLKGERAEALFTYQRLMALLATELQTEPAWETKQLLQVIASTSLTPRAELLRLSHLPT